MPFDCSRILRSTDNDNEMRNALRLPVGHNPSFFLSIKGDEVKRVNSCTVPTRSKVEALFNGARVESLVALA